MPLSYIMGYMGTGLQKLKRLLPIAAQIMLAAILALAATALLHLDRPIGAPLFAVTTLEFICARHRRHVAVFFFGLGFGLAIAAIASGYLSAGRVLFDLAVGVTIAVVVAWATRDRDPVARVRETVVPILTTMTVNVRAIGAALRERDEAAAQAAADALGKTAEELRRLDEVLQSVRRSRFFADADLDRCLVTAREVSYAVRGVGVMARHAWWGVLRGKEPVPAALPPMLAALADGMSLLRDELRPGGEMCRAYPQLVSAARWVDVMRSERLGLASAAVAADADAAVLNLLIATGIPVAKADAMLNHVRALPPASTKPAFA
jgi:hypothetical protein